MSELKSDIHLYRIPVAVALEGDSVGLIEDIMGCAVKQFGRYFPLRATLEDISQRELAQRFADNIVNVCRDRAQKIGPDALGETYVQTRWLSSGSSEKEPVAKVDVHFER